MNLTGWAEYDAACHLLAASTIARRTQKFICPGAIDIYGLLDLAPQLSGSERFLVLTAVNLWNGHGTISLRVGLDQLGDAYFDRFIEALCIYGGRVPTLASKHAYR